MIASSSMKPISAGEALSQMTEEMGKRRKMLVNQVSRRSKPEQAIALLYSDYENRLDLDSFVYQRLKVQKMIPISYLIYIF